MRNTALGLSFLMAALIGGCAGSPFAPSTSSGPAPVSSSSTAPTKIAAPAWFDSASFSSTFPTEILMLGEQHDADEHHVLEAYVVQSMVEKKQLAALVLEMADNGATTIKLPPTASAADVQKALAWDDKGWPWKNYGPAIMAAVAGGVPVVGANVPRSSMKDAMADVSLDVQLSGPALKAQQQAIRKGHCDQLPESQITPMTRIQIARDRSMAHALAEAVVPGKTVVLIAGAGHTDKYLGVPQHLPNTVTFKSVQMKPQAAASSERVASVYDAIWTTPTVPTKDYCAAFTAK